MLGNCYPGHLFLNARRMLHRTTLGLPNKRGQLGARLSELGSMRNQTRSATSVRAAPKRAVKIKRVRRQGGDAIRKSRQGFPRRLVRCVFTWRRAGSIRNRIAVPLLVWTHALS
jgi:hypothetical protein